MRKPFLIRRADTFSRHIQAKYLLIETLFRTKFVFRPIISGKKMLICGFHNFWCYQKLKLKVVFIKTRVIRLKQRP